MNSAGCAADEEEEYDGVEEEVVAEGLLLYAVLYSFVDGLDPEEAGFAEEEEEVEEDDVVDEDAERVAVDELAAGDLADGDNGLLYSLFTGFAE